MSIFHKKVYVHDFATMLDGDIDLGSYGQFNNVTITLEASGLTAADGEVTFLQKAASSLTWNTPVGLVCTLTTTPMGEELCNGDFGSDHIGVRMAKKANTAGRVTVYVTAKYEGA